MCLLTWQAEEACTKGPGKGRAGSEGLVRITLGAAVSSNGEDFLLLKLRGMCAERRAQGMETTPCLRHFFLRFGCVYAFI